MCLSSSSRYFLPKLRTFAGNPCVRLSRRDESFVIISGAVTIELTDSGETVELQRGDVASFPNGTPSVWTVVEPLEKFTVVSG